MSGHEVDTGGLVPQLDAAARSRLDALIDVVRVDASRISTIFPAVARIVARGPAVIFDPDGLRAPRLEDQARVALLVAAARAGRWGRQRLADEISALYRYGDADEKRAVLRSLDVLDDSALDDSALGDSALGDSALGDAAVPLVTDALRTNDTRLVAAALGRYAARHLDTASWRHGVLKCVFLSVPLQAVCQLAERADDELARMITDYVHERVAAGRPVPPDAALVLDRMARQNEEN